MDQPEQREATLGSFGELMMLIVASTLLFGFVTVLGTGLLVLYGNRSDAWGFAFAGLFVIAIATYGSRELAVVTISEEGLRVRRLFTSELVLWVDVLQVDYQAVTSNLVITVRSQSKWFRGRNVRVFYRPASKLGLDWREGLKETFREVFGTQLPEEIAFLQDRIAAAQQSSSRG
jgi:hypothetical protein